MISYPAESPCKSSKGSPDDRVSHLQGGLDLLLAITLVGFDASILGMVAAIGRLLVTLGRLLTSLLLLGSFSTSNSLHAMGLGVLSLILSHHPSAREGLDGSLVGETDCHAADVLADFVAQGLVVMIVVVSHRG